MVGPAVGGELLAAPGNDPTHPEESSQKEPRWSARDGFRAPPVSDEALWREWDHYLQAGEVGSDAPPSPGVNAGR